MKTYLFYLYNLILMATSCFFLLLLLIYITGCSGGGGSETNSTTEITNCVESPGMTTEEVDALIAEAEAANVPVEGAKNQEGNTIVVGCGGTFVDTNTEITTNTENNETNNELTRFVSAIRNGDIAVIELR